MKFQSSQQYYENLRHYNNKSVYYLQSIIDEINYFSAHFMCILNTNPMNFCSNLTQILKSYSYLGKCQTYLYKTNEYYNNMKNYLDNSYLYQLSRLNVLFSYDNALYHLTNKFYIHSQKSLPLLHSDYYYFTDMSETLSNGFTIKISKSNFQKLPKPYETNCFDYENSTQFECLNDCYINGYIKEFNCIPNQNNLITFQFIGRHTVPNNTFCINEDNKKVQNTYNILLKKCNIICPDSCDHDQFESNYEELDFNKNNIRYYKTYLRESHYIIILHSPKMTMIQLMINVINLSANCETKTEKKRPRMTLEFSFQERRKIVKIHTGKEGFGDL